MKKIISVLLTLLMALSITACGSSSGKSTKMSNKLKDLTFTLDNKVYKLPFAYSTLVEDGWTMEESILCSENDIIEPNGYKSAYMIKADNRVHVELTNLSEKSKPLSECEIGGIHVTKDGLSDTSLFKIAKGITGASSEEDVIKAFGKKNSRLESDEETVLSYDFDKDNLITASFSFNKKDTGKNYIHLQNFKNWSKK